VWLLSAQGFYSVVADRDDDRRVLVRTRTRGDLEALRRQIADLEIEETLDADYRWPARVFAFEWVAAAAQLADEIDYPSFEEAVAERQGPRRASLYSSVWDVLRRLQRWG
jgi:hypothetical protein